MTNTFATLVVTYIFNISNWSVAEISYIDRKILKSLTLNIMLHPKGLIVRPYFPSKESDRGLLQLRLTMNIATISIVTYPKTWWLDLQTSLQACKQETDILRSQIDEGIFKWIPNTGHSRIRCTKTKRIKKWTVWKPVLKLQPKLFRKK